MPSTRRTALLLGGLLVCLLAAPALASPQPDPLCGACGSSFESVAEGRGLALNVTRSTATVQVHENGSATWVVTNRVTDTGPGTDADALRAVARRAATDGWGLPHVYDDGEVTVQSTRVENGTVRLRFRDPDAAQRHAGVLVVNYLHSEGVRGGWIRNAEFSVVGPNGTTVGNDSTAPFDPEYTEPSELPTVDGDTVSWQGSAVDEHGYGSAFHDDVYLAFAQPGTAGYRVDAALALATAPIWLDNVRSFVLPTVLVAALLAAGVAAAARRIGETDLDAGRFAAVVAGLGALGVLTAGIAAVLDEPSWFVGVAAVYLVTGAAAARTPERLRTVRGALDVGAAALLVAGSALLALEAAARGSVSWLGTARGIAVHAPLAFAPAFGAALVGRSGTDRALLARAYVGLLATVAVAGMVFVPYDSRPWGLVLMLMLGATVVGALGTLPLAGLASRVQAGE